MKKTFFICFLLMIGAITYAQKSYVLLHYPGSSTWVLSGDIPDDMKSSYEQSAANPVKFYNLAVNILNELSERGYEIEFMTGSNTYLLSKKKSNSSNAIQRVRIEDDDSEVYEVARYNLQGLPINENEKGIQIIVYSNYTTKTVIVQ